MKEFAGLMDANETTAYLKVPRDRLDAWTQSGHAPHYTIDGNGPYYKKSEIANWFRQNMVVRRGGMPVPKTLSLMQSVHSHAMSGAIPSCICALETLCAITLSGGCPGVYFLCDGNEVVYVGQSTNVVYRVATHIMEGKKRFDHHRVFYVPCHPEALDKLEQQFIVQLNPKYNGGMFSKYEKPSKSFARFAGLEYPPRHGTPGVQLSEVASIPSHD